MNILFIGLLVALLIWIISQLRTLIRNYRAACVTGLPIVICPYDPDSFNFAVVSEPLRPVLKAAFPATMITTFEVTCWGWEFHDKGAAHERLGQAFIVVTTGHNRLVCADPGMAHSILARRRDFLHPDISLKTMGLLGPNLVTSKDESWSRQRRIIVPAFNERISGAVWKEGVQQASSLIEHMMSCVSAPKSTTTTASSTADTSSDSLPGLRAIAINVLTRVAYGRHTAFSISSSYRNSEKSLSYVDAIALVTDLLLAAAFVPSSILRLPFMPRLSKRLGQALVQLPSLTTDMLNQERLRLSNDAQNNIMTTLLRLSDLAKVDDRNHGTISTRAEKKQYLTENEITGNLFILTAAGFDTTSNTMSYALVLLAAYPQWQAWIQAEIDDVLRDHNVHLAQEEYATIFPRLTRCLAIMFETLRLYPAVSLLIRTIDIDQTIVTSESSSFPLQAPCAVHVNTMASHTSQLEWGSDRLVFNPSRWLQSGAGFHVPNRGTYMPWSSGPRACPGQKMSQVDFVSVILTIFRSCSVEPVLEDGETMEWGRERLLDLLQDSQPVLTLQINRPKEVRLRWMRR